MSKYEYYVTTDLWTLDEKLNDGWVIYKTYPYSDGRSGAGITAYILRRRLNETQL
jgi:hypothetical protein